MTLRYECLINTRNNFFNSHLRIKSHILLYYLKKHSCCWTRSYELMKEDLLKSFENIPLLELFGCTAIRLFCLTSWTKVKINICPVRSIILWPSNWRSVMLWPVISLITTCLIWVEAVVNNSSADKMFFSNILYSYSYFQAWTTSISFLSPLNDNYNIDNWIGIDGSAISFCLLSRFNTSLLFIYTAAVYGRWRTSWCVAANLVVVAIFLVGWQLLEDCNLPSLFSVL